MNEEKSSKLVFSAAIARKLLKVGCTIVDIKAAKDDPTHNKSVFVFRNDEHFQEELAKILAEKAAQATVQQ